MDKNAIKKYAVWARRELISRVGQRAALYGITEKDCGDANVESINGVILSDTEKTQRKALITQIKAKGYEEVMEEVAYTWFNRFSALRFMEVNGYLPTHVRVFTDDENRFAPQIMAEAINLELDGLDMEKVYDLKNNNDNDQLFKYLIITQCNALNAILPGMFQKLSDYTELLFPDNLLREGSVIEQMITMIPADNFDVGSENGQLEIIGWLYQYYNDERKSEVINMATKTVISKDDIPAATQLFTTDWVVRYIVDNSVGRYWIERVPSSTLVDELTYYDSSIETFITDNEKLAEPQLITVLDPCVGSGHFLVYAFDVLMKIYNECGYNDREAVTEIICNNLYGVDIDARAAQLAYFAVMMKGRQYDARFFRRGLQPHVHEIKESNYIDKSAIEFLVGDDINLERQIQKILISFTDAKEYGSIIQPPDVDYDGIIAKIDSIRDEISIYNYYLQHEFRSFLVVARLLAKKYAVVVTNPPYLNKFDTKLRNYLFTYYNDYKGDLFSVFIFRNFGFCKDNGYVGFMAPFVWMFIKTYEKLRNYILETKSITTLIQMEYSAFEEATVPICSFVLKNGCTNTRGTYFRLSDFKGGMEVQNSKVLEALADNNCGYYYVADQKNFMKIPGSPIAYWLNPDWFELFESSKKISEIAKPRVGQNTGDNERFLRLWHEVIYSKIGFGVKHDELSLSSAKWIPYSKGGAFRRWYGNYYYVINWANDGQEIKEFAVIRNNGKHWSRYIQNLDYMCCEGVTWSDISSSKFACRYLPEGFICDVKGSSAYPDKDTLLTYLAFLNSNITYEGLKVLAPTISFQTGDIGRLPFKVKKSDYASFEELTNEQIVLSKADWDAFEISWDFFAHPLIRHDSTLKEAFETWENECNIRFYRMKANEEELNRRFILMYNLEKDVSSNVEEKDITVRKADIQRDIRSLISYAVGCMFGRYSLDIGGLAYAGGEWDDSKYSSFPADRDNIIPICDDEYFEDDIVNRFVKFIEVVYGKDTLEENLKFIADALDEKGQPREVLRNYFLNDFYNDHCSTYSVTGSGKRPIYWLFDSGKKNGFKCLIYMHRYQPDTIARIRTDYVHEQQSRYRTAIGDLETRLATANTSERVKLNKQLKKLQDQAEEVRVYEEKIHHLADQMISIDLDDGVKVNYAKFQDVLAKIK